MMPSRPLTKPLATAALAVLLSMAGCAQQAPTGSTAAPAGSASVDRNEQGDSTDMFESTAMVVAGANGSLLFIDQDNGTPYVPTAIADAQVIGLSGEVIVPAELASGNVVRVTGNGIMLESYPGQYPGISKIEVLEEGSPEDAAQYDELIAQVFPEKDPSEPAQCTFTYRTDLAVVSLAPVQNGWTWTVTDADGTGQTAIADVPHPAQLVRDELPDAVISAATDATAGFDMLPSAATVTRWSEDEIAAAVEAHGSEQEIDPAALSEEQVDATVENGELTFTIEPGWRYRIEATFDAGTVAYVFTTRS